MLFFFTIGYTAGTAPWTLITPNLLSCLVLRYIWIAIPISAIINIIARTIGAAASSIFHIIYHIKIILIKIIYAPRHLQLAYSSAPPVTRLWYALLVAARTIIAAIIINRTATIGKIICSFIIYVCSKKINYYYCPNILLHIRWTIWISEFVKQSYRYTKYNNYYNYCDDRYQDF